MLRAIWLASLNLGKIIVGSNLTKDIDKKEGKRKPLFMTGNSVRAQLVDKERFMGMVFEITKSLK